MRLTFLTNPDPIRQEKMRFFSDYYSFVNEFLGLLPEFPFENCLSLINKILFQIRNNLDNCAPYIENYYQQLNFFYSPNFIKKSSAFILVEKDFQKMESKYNSCKSVKKKTIKRDWINSHPSFIKHLERIEREFAKDFDKNFDTLFRLLQCSHPLKEHVDAIKFCTHNLVAELRLKGHSQDALDGYINRLLGKEDFPLPPKIINIKNKELRNKKRTEFLSNRTFKEQFYGFKNIIDAYEFKSGFFIYKIENCFLDKKVQKEFYVQIEEVIFCSPFHSSLSKLRSSIKKRDKERPFKAYSRFFNERILLAFLKLSYESTDSAMKIGLSKVKQELIQLNGYINTNLSVNTNDYLFTESLSLGVEAHRFNISKKSIPTIDEHNLSVAKTNPYEILRTTKSIAKPQILSSENTFFLSVHDINLSFYWVYIENLFRDTKFQNNDERRKKIVRILLNCLVNFKNKFLVSMLDVLFTDMFVPKELGISHEDRKYAFQEIKMKRNFNFDFSQHALKIKNPIFDKMLLYQKNFLSNQQKEKWRQFFSSLILELYEFRNSELHSGKINPLSKMKLLTVIPTLINQVRRNFIDGCRDNPHLSFEDLIIYLSK